MLETRKEEEEEEEEWASHPANQSVADVAARFGRSREWAQEHVGKHRCVDGRFYVRSCLVSDPSCDQVARYYLRPKTI